MRVLFDQGTPVPLRKYLTAHEVVTTFDLGWGRLGNGELLNHAESAGFEVLVTTDRNLKYQQNLTGRKISIVVVATTSWPRIRKVVATVAKAVDAAAPSGYIALLCRLWNFPSLDKEGWRAIRANLSPIFSIFLKYY